MGDWGEKWNMKGSQKQTQRFVILSKMGRPCICGKGVCEPINFLFCALSHERFIHSPLNSAGSLQLWYLAPLGFQCVGWTPRALGGSPLGGHHADGEGGISSSLLQTLLACFHCPGLMAFSTPPTPHSPEPCQGH